MSVEPAPLSDAPHALAEQIRSFASQLRRRLRDHGAAHDFTPTQVAVLLRLENSGAAAVSTLARGEGIRPQSMSAAVAGLLQAQLVQGAPDPNDGRQTLLSLTPKCRKWLVEGRAAKQDWLMSAIAQRLSSREQKQVREAMALLNRLVED